jgi:hypothetical protein
MATVTKKPIKKLPPPGGFAPKRGEPDGRCPYCSFMPTNRNDFCDTHRKEMR